MKGACFIDGSAKPSNSTPQQRNGNEDLQRLQRLRSESIGKKQTAFDDQKPTMYLFSPQ